MTQVLIDREVLERLAEHTDWAAENYTHGDAIVEAKVDAAAARAALEAKPVEPVAWRWQVVAFANAMEERLRANDHKGGWSECGAQYLFDRLREETAELDDVTEEEAFPEDVLHEAADVANFAMMIADTYDALHAPPEHTPQVPLADAGGESTPESPAVACPDWDMSAAAILHLNDIEAQLGGSNGPTIRLRQLVLDMKAQLTAEREARQKAEKDAELFQWIYANCSYTGDALMFPERFPSLGDLRNAIVAAIAQGKEPTWPESVKEATVVPVVAREADGIKRLYYTPEQVKPLEQRIAELEANAKTLATANYENALELQERVAELERHLTATEKALAYARGEADD